MQGCEVTGLADNSIKQRIELTGEKEYNQALAEARRNLKTLRSELKAETAELGANATAQQKNEVKLKSLQKQIKEQEKVVKTYTDALAEVKEKYPDNADAIAKWEQKLNDARTTLANMKNSLDQTGESFKGIENGAKRSTVETYALAESFGKISSAAGSMSSAMESIFASVIGTIRTAIQSVWGDLMEIAGKADNYQDLAEFLGASPTEVQKWTYAMKGANNEFSTITSLISRLRYGGKSDKITEWFGVSAENYTNDLEYIQQVLQAMYESKEAMREAGTWDDAMSDILGAKKVQEVDGVLSDWEAILSGLERFNVDNGGLGLSKEDIDLMAQLNTDVKTLEASWDAFKAKVETTMFGHLALDLTSNAQGALDALISLMDADTQEERDKAIEDFKNNITEAFTKIGEAIEAAAEALNQVGTELQGSENGYVRLLGDILVNLSKAMEWLTDEGSLDKVLNFFRQLFDLWIGAKAVQAVGTIANLVTHLTNFRNLFHGMKLPGGGGTETPTATPTGGGGGVSTWLTSLFPGLSQSIGNTASAISTYDPTGSLGLLYSVLQDQTVFLRTLRNGGGLDEAVSSSWETIKASATEGTNNFVKYFTEDLPNAFWSALGITPEDFNYFFARRDENADAAERLPTGADWRPGYQQGYEPNYYNPNMPYIPAYSWTDRNELTSDDLSSFRGLPAEMSKAVASGAAAGVSGITVNLDGQKVGILVAPYVSQEIARDIP